MSAEYRWIYRRLARTTVLLRDGQTRKQTITYLFNHTAFVAASRLRSTLLGGQVVRE